MPVGLIATTVRLIPSIRATSATRPARRDGREDRRYGSMPPRRFVTNFLPTPAGNLRRPEHPEDELLILNYHLPAVTLTFAPHPSLFLRDGGANRLYDELPAMLPRLDPKDVRAAHIPSASSATSTCPTRGPALLRRRARAVDLSHDQDTTDLHKLSPPWSPRRTRTRTRTEGTRTRSAAAPPILVGALGGRFDHEMSNPSAMHESRRRASPSAAPPWRRSYPRASPRPSRTSARGTLAGLVPMQGPASVKTAGLRGDLDGGSAAVRGVHQHQ